MSLPNFNPGGSSEIIFLEQTDQELLRSLIGKERNRLELSNAESDNEQYLPAPEVLIVKLPDDGIPACTTTTETSGAETIKPGKAECEIWRIKPTKEVTPFTADSTLVQIKVEGLTAPKIWVFNIYPVKWYSKAGVATFLRATKDRSGRFLIEKPRNRYKCKAKQDIEPGGHGNTGLYYNGAEIAAIQGYNDWMNNGIKISNNIEGIVEYFPDEKHWSWVEAACEEP